MGIINVTPDSFSDGGENFSPDDALKTAKKMFSDGADILDIGGQSTRPGHTPVDGDEEWRRIASVVSGAVKLGAAVSVDTYYPSVARRALESGAHIINDVSGAVSPEMAAVVKEFSAGWVIMHNAAGDQSPAAVHRWLRGAAEKAESLGVPRECICLDPGIGFGKTNEESLRLIAATAEVRVPGYAYLLAASRKRCIGEALGGLPPEERDAGTSAANIIGIMGGADIIRVHNVKMACEAARVADRLLR